ncbi:MAG: GAF domain-containing protein [Synergistetes bacterium]|nr:GAF domain-containing protein [Synergistota bacterium]
MGDIKEDERGDDGAVRGAFGLLIGVIIGFLLAFFGFSVHRDWIDLLILLLLAFLVWKVYLYDVKRIRRREEFGRIIAEFASKLGSALTKLAVLKEAILFFKWRMKDSDVRVFIYDKGSFKEVKLVSETVVLEDVGEDIAYALEEVFEKRDVLRKGEFLYTPISYGTENRGVLRVKVLYGKSDLEVETNFWRVIALKMAVFLSKAEIITSLQKTNRRFFILYDVARNLGRRYGSEKEFMETLVSLIMHHLRAVNVAIFLKEGESLKHICGAGKLSGRCEGLELRFDGNSMVEKAFLTGEPVVVKDFTCSSHKAVCPMMCSGMAVPLKLRDKVVGVIVIEGEEVERFDEEDLEIMKAIAGLMEVSMERIRYLQSLRATHSRLLLLYGISRRFTALVEMEEAANELVKMLCKELKYLSVMLLLEKDGYLHQIASCGLPEEFKDREIALSESNIVSEVFRTERPYIARDVEKDPLYLKWDDRVKGQLSVPIKKDGKIYGVLTVTTTGEKILPQDIEALTILANLFAHVLEREELYFSITLALAKTIEMKDPYTHGHCERVMKWALLLADKVGLSPKDKKNLRYAAVLHDIGKIGVPGRILNKPGKLTDEEYDMVKKHPILGEEILRPISLFKEVAKWVRWHHERWDGKGYPDGLKGEEIPIGVRILSLADSFDAMVSDRPYRSALSLEKAMREIRENRGKQFDPVLADIFLEILRERNGKL